MLLGFVLPANAIKKGRSSNKGRSSSLTTNTIFQSQSASIKTKLGASLTKAGFLLDSQTQKQYKIYDENRVLYTKIYKKGDYTVEYSYYDENDPFFISLKIVFPTISACEFFFKDVVKRVKADERYWDSVPGGFHRGAWKYGKDKCERLGWGSGSWNEYWCRNGKIFTYNFENEEANW